MESLIGSPLERGLSQIALDKLLGVSIGMIKYNSKMLMGKFRATNSTR